VRRSHKVTNCSQFASPPSSAPIRQTPYSGWKPTGRNSRPRGGCHSAKFAYDLAFLLTRRLTLREIVQNETRPHVGVAYFTFLAFSVRLLCKICTTYRGHAVLRPLTYSQRVPVTGLGPQKPFIYVGPEVVEKWWINVSKPAFSLPLPRSNARFPSPCPARQQFPYNLGQQSRRQ